MKNFKIAGFSYKKSCEIAKKCGIIPLEDPDENLVKVYDSIAAQCLAKISFGDDDMRLAGLYIYRAAEQKDLYDRCSFGLTSMDKDHTQVIIGLGSELFERGTPEFYRIVFLHENGHRYIPALEGDKMVHNDIFTMRLNGIMQDYYCSDAYRPIRGDASGGFLKRKVWTM